jgi:dUTP pyrophosphatase
MFRLIMLTGGTASLVRVKDGRIVATIQAEFVEGLSQALGIGVSVKEGKIVNDPIRITVEQPWLLPVRKHEGDAGADLKAKEMAEIEPGECVNVGTGVRIAIPYGYAGLVFPRSGLATRKGIRLANSVGVVDSGYRDYIYVPLVNESDLVYRVSRGDRIAQLLIVPVALPGFMAVESLSETSRGEGGFGSTGIA